MKISVRHIIADHFRTLTNARTGRISLVDLIIFYGAPAAIAALVILDLDRLPEAFYGLAISVFSIFAALLFSVQIALFSIIQRPYSRVDAKLEESQDRHAKRRRELIREVNANISYLILVACIGLATLLFFSIVPRLDVSRASISCYLVAHFVLTILLVVARVHTLFNEEYARP